MLEPKLLPPKDNVVEGLDCSVDLTGVDAERSDFCGVLGPGSLPSLLSWDVLNGFPPILGVVCTCDDWLIGRLVSLLILLICSNTIY